MPRHTVRNVHGAGPVEREERLELGGEHLCAQWGGKLSDLFSDPYVLVYPILGSLRSNNVVVEAVTKATGSAVQNNVVCRVDMLKVTYRKQQ